MLDKALCNRASTIRFGTPCGETLKGDPDVSLGLSKLVALLSDPPGSVLLNSEKGDADVKFVVSGLGSLAKVPGSRIGKWVVVVLWVGALAALAPLAGKLTSVEDNQAASWLPGDAESTQVLKITERFRSSDQVPTIVVYERPSGLTAADLTAIGEQAHRFAAVDGVNSEVIGPISSTEPAPQAAQ